MNRPSDLVAIPPLARTVIYYLIAEAIIVSLAVDQWLGSGDSWWALAFIIANGNAVLFFGTAAAKVTTSEASFAAKVKPAPSVVEDTTGGIWGGGEKPDGYAPGVDHNV